MKTQSNLTAAVSIAALLTGSVIFAQDAETVTPEIAICEPAPEIAVCPEPFISPEAPEICILPPPTEEPISVDIHIDPVIEETTDPVEGPSDTEFTDGGEGLVDENEVIDSGDPSENNEVTTTVEDDSVDFEKGVPIEWLMRGGSNEDPSVILYSMAGNPAPVLEKEDAPNALAGNSVSDNLAPSLNKEESPNALARGLGQDDKAAAIMMKANTASPKVLSEKNEPTALIKKGRVFLR